MPFIIDGYNMIHRDRRLGDVIDERGARAARDGLVAMLASFAERSGREVTAVFDGGKMDDPLLPRRERRGAVEVRYSAHGVSADELIEEMIAGHRTPADLYVVSDDKSVGRAIEAHGAHHLGVIEFLEKIRAAMRSSRTPDDADEKPAEVSPGEVEYWLRAMGIREDLDGGGARR